MDLSELPEFEVIDERAWQELKERMNVNWYGESVLRFSAIWAKKMEARLANGERIQSCAVATAVEVEKELGGTENFVYGHAVQTLKKVWEHGEALANHYNV